MSSTRSPPKRMRRASVISSAPPAIPELPPIAWSAAALESMGGSAPLPPLPLDAFDDRYDATAAASSSTSSSSSSTAPDSNIDLHSLLANDASASASLSSALQRAKETARRHDASTTELIKYLESELGRKDMLSRRLSQQLSHLHASHQQQVASMENHTKQTLAAMEKLFLQTEEKMISRCDTLTAAINDLSSLKEARAQLASDLELTKQAILKQEREHRHALEQLEQKFIAEKETLAQQAAEKIAQARRNYKAEVASELELESAQVRNEHESTKSNLAVAQQTSDRIQYENEALEAKIKQRKNEIESAIERRTEVEKQRAIARRKKAEIVARIDTCQQSLDVEWREYEASKANVVQRYQHEMQLLEHNVAQARLRAATEDDLNRRLRSKARRLLSQKKEAQTFFLRAIDETKHTIMMKEHAEKMERNMIHEQQRKARAMNKEMRREILGALEAFISSSSSSSQPSAVWNDDHVPGVGAATLADLTLQDRAKLLRLLYAKIVQAPSALMMALPKHSFDLEITQQQQLLQHEGEQKMPTLNSAQQQASPLRPRPPSALPPPAATASTEHLSSQSAPTQPQLLMSAGGHEQQFSQQPRPQHDLTFLTNQDTEEFEDEDDDGGYEDDGTEE